MQSSLHKAFQSSLKWVLRPHQTGPLQRERWLSQSRIWFTGVQKQVDPGQNRQRSFFM